MKIDVFVSIIQQEARQPVDQRLPSALQLQRAQPQLPVHQQVLHLLRGLPLLHQGQVLLLQGLPLLQQGHPQQGALLQLPPQRGLPLVLQGQILLLFQRLLAPADTI